MKNSEQVMNNFGCGLIARTDLTLPFHGDRAAGFDRCGVARHHEQAALGTRLRRSNKLWI